MRAFLGLRDGVHYRREAFTRGLERCGYTVVHEITNKPRDGDLLVLWNRYGPGGHAADIFEARGLPVLVAENATWGNDFAAERWYSLWRGRHNTAGNFPVGDLERWDALGVELQSWRPAGGEVVGLPQRGIGPVGTAMPRGWVPRGCDRIRHHPGTGDCVPLEKDLARASRVITWGSGAAVKALTWGIPVTSYMPDWCAQQDNTDAGRLAMFRRLAWAQWRLAEIESGEAFRCLLS
ncbi:MAG: hypothetical protein M3Q42_10365 [Pseudomonadota bacterium]|nr:hypothetical protein [Pseudomonadota bacterium]